MTTKANTAKSAKKPTTANSEPQVKPGKTELANGSTRIDR